jgi:ATP-dependent DNA helicase recQ
LLIDDIIDSGWTITVAAILLKQKGCGDVFPAALSTTGKL